MDFDLLDTVLPPEGRYCVIGIDRFADQKFADTREEAEELIQEIVSKKVDAYFACAKFGTADNRTHENAHYFRALWMDIDCGPTKGVPNSKGIVEGYLDQEIGMAEFQKFCKTVGLHRPILVNSGNGIHAYWLFDRTLNRKEWTPLAKRLKALCKEHGLIVDEKVFEASRVLRPLNSANFKNKNEPKPVTLLNEHTKPLSYEAFKELLGAPDPVEEPDFVPRAMSPMMEALMGNKVKKFKTIMMLGEKGCAQLNYCYQNQEEIGEPLWMSALSIPAFCVDGDKAAHKMSENHPEYDPLEVNQKLKNIRKNGGPHHCDTFEERNPGGCEGCPHRGKFKSPIVLGVEIEQATEEDNEVEVETDKGVTKHQIPEYPFPFFRGKKGGIYVRPQQDDEEGEPKLVYEHDLYVIKRMRDKELGEMALFRHHLPHDGMKEFAITTASISSKDELRKQLAQQGVMAHHKQYENLATYVVTSVKNLQYTKKAELMRTQFGWVDGDSKFIMGDKEITKDGTFYSPPSSTTDFFAEKIHAKGDMEKWKEVFNLYAQPGMEGHAFAALTAFGAPLFKFTGLKGAIINVIYEQAGSGKSTILRMCNSVYGMPYEMMAIEKDTLNAKMQQLGVMNNLPNTIDEITNMLPKEFSDLAYGISQGRGKHRVKGSENALRVNNTSWQNMTLASANAAFHEKLQMLKNTPDGESVRLLEYKIEPNDIIGMAYGKEMFDHQLNENYGHAGEIYLSYLVNNLESAKADYKMIQAKIDSDVQFTSRERFWSAVCATIITGGLIAKNLGLHNYDMKAIYKWMKNMLSEMRVDVKPPSESPVTALGEFVNAHLAMNTLVVNGEVDARTNMQAMPGMEPRGELLIRYEPDNKHLYVSAKHFKEFCIKQQINYKGTLKTLTDQQILLETVNKRMSKGMKLSSPVVRTLKFDAGKSEYLQLDTVTADEDRDSVVSD